MVDPPQTTVFRQARQLLESLQAAGVHQLPQAETLRNAKPLRPDVIITEEIGPLEGIAPMSQPPLEEGPLPCSVAPTLETLRQEVTDCSACLELASTRTQIVFGVGNPQARLCLLGEAPGADEDRQGEPFVGRSGQLLNKILEACQLRREDVYILNVLKCRPPGNRNPTPEESQNCRRFLNRQLQLIAPEFICCLGSVAAQNLLATTETIGKLRGRDHQAH